MITIKVRNINEAFPLVINMLNLYGNERGSRNGPVLVIPEPVTIHYTNPTERVLFNPIRDCNPFFHLYESLWMLMGRNDVLPLTRYTKQVANYSDDGLTLYGAYGYRWRNHGSPYADEVAGNDQLKIIVKRLKEDPNDRHSILQMWNYHYDL